jgi:hypothetical protein
LLASLLTLFYAFCRQSRIRGSDDMANTRGVLWSNVEKPSIQSSHRRRLVDREPEVLVSLQAQHIGVPALAGKPIDFSSPRAPRPARRRPVSGLSFFTVMPNLANVRTDGVGTLGGSSGTICDARLAAPTR